MKLTPSPPGQTFHLRPCPRHSTSPPAPGHQSALAAGGRLILTPPVLGGCLVLYLALQFFIAEL